MHNQQSLLVRQSDSPSGRRCIFKQKMPVFESVLVSFLFYFQF
ncbi:hypothetical protein RNAN_3275 [Rheinheimera nanhaiensis E407-8]|uniref:Uncharacterized protein n=1 Tax=Rheinheimera nanhaiensis E407-8 TaxID=562729 RepID=I1E1S8_9GAMM|nr:hypothetical protein RNAN_3275 [Rheinheimera nanhaiensis E407-8]